MTRLILTDHSQTKMSKGLLIPANVRFFFTPFHNKEATKDPLEWQQNCYGGPIMLTSETQSPHHESIDSLVADLIKAYMKKNVHFYFTTAD